MTEDGPYEVEGAVPIAQQIIEPNEDGESWEWRPGVGFEPPLRPRCQALITGRLPAQRNLRTIVGYNCTTSCFPGRAKAAAMG